MNIAIQLYTLRKLTDEDFVGTLSKIAEMGYNGVEFAGYKNICAEDMRKYLSEFNLKAAGTHVSYKSLIEDFDSVIDYCVKLGVESAVVPHAKFETYNEWIEFANNLNIYGSKFRENGILFGYHNHAHEFEKINGEYILDIIFGNTDPMNVVAELDTHWIKKGGEDPVEYVAKYKGRVPLIHAKDITSNGDEDTEVGSGIIDFKSVANASGDVKWIIVEQESFKMDALESVAISLNNLKRIFG